MLLLTAPPSVLAGQLAGSCGANGRHWQRRRPSTPDAGGRLRDRREPTIASGGFRTGNTAFRRRPGDLPHVRPDVRDLCEGTLVSTGASSLNTDIFLPLGHGRRRSSTSMASRWRMYASRYSERATGHAGQANPDGRFTVTGLEPDGDWSVRLVSGHPLRWFGQSYEAEKYVDNDHRSHRTGDWGSWTGSGLRDHFWEADRSRCPRRGVPGGGSRRPPRANRVLTKHSTPAWRCDIMGHRGGICHDLPAR